MQRIRCWLPRFNTSYEIYAAKPIGPALAQLRRIRIALLVLVPVGLVFAGLAGYSLAKRSLRPLQELARVIDEVTSSDLSRRVKLPSQGWRRGFRTRLTIQRAARSAGASFQCAAALHGRCFTPIRTPVTIALASAQVTNHDPNATLADCKEALQIIENQMLQLRRTVEDMFFLSQSDAVSMDIDSETNVHRRCSLGGGARRQNPWHARSIIRC